MDDSQVVVRREDVLALIDLTAETEAWLTEFCDDPEDEDAQNLIRRHREMLTRCEDMVR